jgi:PadR family transcriptional regulator PadR
VTGTILFELTCNAHAQSLRPDTYGIARRIEQTSGDLLSVNYGTLYPQLLKLEQEGAITSSWGVSENNRKAKFYQLTRAGRQQVARETRDWDQATAILARFFKPVEER